MLFKYEKRAKQLIDYEGLCYGGMHPIDIDGCFELDNHKLILIEYKTGATPMPDGQRLTYERIADAWEQVNGVAVVIVAEHFSLADDIVDGSTSIVREIYLDGRWRNYEGLRRTVRTVMDNIIGNDIEKRNE